MPCDIMDEPCWVRVEITRPVHIFSGFDDDSDEEKKEEKKKEEKKRAKRVLIHLGGTPYFILEKLLIDNGIIPKVGLIVEVEYFGPEIGNIRMLDEDEQNLGLIAS